MSRKNKLSDYYKGKNVLITGITGFIGTNLANKLHELGANVYGVSRNPKPSRSFIFSKCDVTNFKQLEKVFSEVEPEIVFHLASLVVGKRELDIVIPTFNANLTSTVNVLTLCTNSSVKRLVHIGSMEEPKSGIASSPYAMAKKAAAMYAKMFFKLYKTPVVHLKLFMVYGPGQMDWNKLIPYVISSIINKKSPKLSSGRRKVDWIYIDDVVQAILIAGQKKNLEGKSIEIGSGIQYTVGEIVKYLYGISGTKDLPNFGDLADRKHESQYVADVKRTYKLLDWKSGTNIKEGLMKTLSWYKQL